SFHEKVDAALIRYWRIAGHEAASERVHEHLNHFMAACLAEHIDIVGRAHQRQWLAVSVGMKPARTRGHFSSDDDRPSSDRLMTKGVECVDGGRALPNRSQVACGLFLQGSRYPHNCSGGDLRAERNERHLSD